MEAFYYTSPPPPPRDALSSPPSLRSGYYSPKLPAPSARADPPSSPPLSPPSPASSSPASQPRSAPLDGHSSPPCHSVSTPLSPAIAVPPPPQPLPAPPAFIPPMMPIYYRSPPPPPRSFVPPPPPPPSSSPPPEIPSPVPYNTNPPPHVRRPPSQPPPPSRPSVHRQPLNNGSSRSTMGTTATVATFAVVAGFVMLGFVGAAVWLVKKRKKPLPPISHGGDIAAAPSVSTLTSDIYPHARSPPYPPVRHGSEGSSGIPFSQSESGLGHTKSWFTLDELSMITDNFSHQNLLGEGGSGCVYKGYLTDGREVAVKKLKVSGTQGERHFRAEVGTISRAHHRHLVSLVGYCVSENQRLLVYDYVPNKTLYYHLHGKGRPVMQWAKRVKVAAGTARGIAYLHEDCQPRIIHRDIKSSNILLDYNFEAKVSDFGLARSAMDGNSHVSTRVMGTFGYLAPEYATSGKLTAKSDVYSFGVVLLELITGRKPVDSSQPLGDECLAEWARPLLIQALENGDFRRLPDPRLNGNYDRDEMLHIIEVAAVCIRHSSTMRPRMTQVVRALDNLTELDINNGVPPGHSESFDSPKSEEIRMFQRMGFGSEEDEDEDIEHTRTR
ncbi:proline-rich receptor-like protein kinase PERK8 [Curcuma longa]|uniref:proline-rich receptor-like protein kinase PERK8 n=1 Tax=Curcuma longa TaxID=136217 RepID=UPI003D9F1DAC